MGEPVWYIPVGLVAVGIAWSIRKLQPFILQVFIAVIVPAILSAVAACIPEWLHPSPPGEGAFGWTVVLAALWAMWSIPTCLVAVIIFNFIRRFKNRESRPNKEE